MPSFPVHHQLPELTRTHVHQVSDAIQPSHPLPFLSPTVFHHAHGDLTSLAPHERLPEILVVPREKTPTGRDWGQEEKGTTEDEMAGWHHLLDGHESE